MFIENLPYIGLVIVTFGFSIVFFGIFGLAHLDSQQSIRDAIDATLQKGSKQDIFRHFLHEKASNQPRGGVEQVIAMSQQGMDTTQIAKHLNRGKGEVDLIINLKRKRGAVNEK